MRGRECSSELKVGNVAKKRGRGEKGEGEGKICTLFLQGLKYII
jgi:hypothetical protein